MASLVHVYARVPAGRLSSTYPLPYVHEVSFCYYTCDEIAVQCNAMSYGKAGWPRQRGDHM